MKILEKLKSIHRYKTIIGISIFILLLAGIIPSLISCDWVWFSRSGALLVIFGIFIIWLDYQSSIENDLNTVFDGFEKYLIDSTEENTESREKIKTEIQDKFNKVKEANKKRFQNIEFFTVALGTLVWGYGDLINKVVTCFGSA
jgi:energy-coupling factor transporter transmembrane protein EcfT